MRFFSILYLQCLVSFVTVMLLVPCILIIFQSPSKFRQWQDRNPCQTEINFTGSFDRTFKYEMQVINLETSAVFFWPHTMHFSFSNLSNFLFNSSHLIGEEIIYACVFLKLLTCYLFYFQIYLVAMADNILGCLSYHTCNVGQGYLETMK